MLYYTQGGDGLKKVISLLILLCLILLITSCGKSNTTSDELNTLSESSNASSKVLSDNSKVASANSQTSSEPLGVETVTKVYPFKIAATNTTPECIKKVFKDTQSGNTIPYCLYIPNNYSPSKKYPVILYLHGAGSIGNDNSTQLIAISKMFECNGDIVSNAFVICPQSPEWWSLDKSSNDNNGTLSSALRLLNNITEKYSCDKNRIYLTGVSMGAFGTWSMLERHGDVFAAAVPICGGGNSYNGAAFIDIPIKIYHGTKDTTVSFSRSEDMYNAIIKAGGKKVDFIRLEGYDHYIWSHVYSDRELFYWMFSQNKANASDGTSQYMGIFSIRDSKGKIIITDKDVTQTNYHRESKQNKNVVIELTLTSDGRSKLSDAYKSSKGKPFTFYLGTEKIYSFTATAEPKSNIFYIADVFDLDNYYEFYTLIRKRS